MLATEDMVMGLGPQTETAAGQPGTELPDVQRTGVAVQRPWS